ncbi:uncharacterized protein B0I36DRAFT_64905 [Microdochium trichocladiopsis]|uniref:Secreted protein n=1 Tax=Microdochium trichocladiopsis TaxID=1682393 RepID=A0A9P8YDA7_9PEZI|nr:uncharacterized protein B0I36DRAFT_64905 [Microdochium trichocladiopsis]KAH7037355.1 hypothetical protein B0I36DRAFT_64905 [Microdochium trichocladiopsis]
MVLVAIVAVLAGHVLVRAEYRGWWSRIRTPFIDSCEPAMTDNHILFSRYRCPLDRNTECHFPTFNDRGAAHRRGIREMICRGHGSPKVSEDSQTCFACSQILMPTFGKSPPPMMPTKDHRDCVAPRVQACTFT